MLLSISFFNWCLLSNIRFESTAYSFLTYPLGKYFSFPTFLSLKSSSRISFGSLRATPNFPQEINILPLIYPAIAPKQFLNSSWCVMVSLGRTCFNNFVILLRYLFSINYLSKLSIETLRVFTIFVIITKNRPKGDFLPINHNRI